MALSDETVLWIIIGLAAVAILIAAIVVAKHRARLRTAELEGRFGPEYQRAVSELGSRKAAERELAARARRVEHFRFTDLTPADRSRFEARWNRIQTQFVDDPALAVAGANQLIGEVMRARGYPTDDFEQRVADLSVEYPEVVQHYRAAHALASSASGKALDTEELRQAVVHYRVLFAELLHEGSAHHASELRRAHA